MKKLSKETRKILEFNWKLRQKLHAEGKKLWAEGDKLRAEGKKLYAESDKLHAEGSKLLAEANKLLAEANRLRSEADKLRAEADKLWAETIIEFCGNIKLEWKFIIDKQSDSCTLETGDVFLPLWIMNNQNLR